MSEKDIFDTLYFKYKKLFLNKSEISEELGFSESTLNRKLKQKEALPSFVKEGGKYLFPLLGLVKYSVALNKLKNKI